MRQRNDCGALVRYSIHMIMPLAELTVEQLLDRYPRGALFFLERGMLCVGCPTAVFHTLEEVARNYGYPVKVLVDAIEKVLFAETG